MHFISLFSDVAFYCAWGAVVRHIFLSVRELGVVLFLSFIGNRRMEPEIMDPILRRKRNSPDSKFPLPFIFSPWFGQVDCSMSGVGGLFAKADKGGEGNPQRRAQKPTRIFLFFAQQNRFETS